MTAQPVPRLDSFPPSSVVSPARSPVSLAPAPPTPVIWAAEAAEIVRALSHLDPAEATALRLIYWHRMTHAGVAGQLGVPETIVQQRVASGLRKLANRLVPAQRR